MSLVLYTVPGSPFAWKVQLALEHRGVSYELRRLSRDSGDLASAEFLQVNPRGQVPAVVNDDFSLYESAAIIDYIEHAFDGPRLWPSEPKARARAQRITAEAAAYLYPAVRALAEQLVFHPGRAPDEVKVREAKAAIAREAAALNAPEGEISVADFAVYPLLAMLARIDDRAPGHGAVALASPALLARRGLVERQPYFERTFPAHWTRPKPEPAAVGTLLASVFGRAARDRSDEAAGADGARAMLETFYHAFNQRSLTVLEKVWAPDASILLANPLGGIVRGLGEIRALYRRVFEGPARVWVEYYDVTQFGDGEHAVFVGRERGELVHGDQRLPLAFRTTRYFQRIHGVGFRQVHHHGSMDDPSALAAYQRAVR